MLTIQHVLAARLQNANFDNKEYMAAVVFPDAIRKYSGPRQYSHFEKGSNGVNDTSYWQMPTYMKGVTKDSIQRHVEVFGHLSSSITPAAIGEDTDLDAFYEHNNHLPETMYHGIEDHLKQDICFDKFIRTNIDCSGKYNDVYVFHDQTMNGKEVRSLINQIEQHGIYILAYEIYKEYGDVVNQAWFETNIKPILYSEYPEDLAEATYAYMKIDPQIDELITNRDWSKIDDGPLPYESYKTLYKDVLKSMSKNLSIEEYSKIPQKIQDFANEDDEDSDDYGFD